MTGGKQDLSTNFYCYDKIRLDHFRGFEAYWKIPYGLPSATYGCWEKGPGIDFFLAIEEALGKLDLIAEDLGDISHEVVAMREALQYPGMKVMLFGFNGKEDSDHLPHHYSINTIAYVGTHDNDTAKGWFEEKATPSQQLQMSEYLNQREMETVSDALKRGIAQSTSQICIYTMQNLLNLGNEARCNIREARCNIRATHQNNWC